MAPERKISLAPTSAGHPSKSSVAVPRAIRESVKKRHNGRCWLCNWSPQTPRKNCPRKLEICHVFPQAKSKRFDFSADHKAGRTQVDRMHSGSNLVALCHICHFALDENEWTFLPIEMEEWASKIQLEPNYIIELNQQRDVLFRPWRLKVDPDSVAGRDDRFAAAFDGSAKILEVEPGLAILGRTGTFTSSLDGGGEEFAKAVIQYNALMMAWKFFKGSCPRDECLICHETMEGGDGQGDQGSGGGAGAGSQNQKQKGKSRYQLRYTPVRQLTRRSRYGLRPRALARDNFVQERRRDPARKAKSRRDRNFSQIPYDTSVPLSHRVGYTWVDSTSNDQIRSWCRARGIEVESLSLDWGKTKSSG